MTTSTPLAEASVNVTELHLKDYQPPSHWIDKTHLTFTLNAEDDVVVTSRLLMRLNLTSALPPYTLVLSGAPAHAPEGAETPCMELLSITVDGQPWVDNAYSRHGSELTLNQLPNKPFVLEIQTRISPQANRSLNGLYTSGGKFTTQCESQGFRNITFYLDRPDVMSEFTTVIRAHQGKYAQLLSNGNPSERVTTADGWDEITWHDPHKKPCYLFALVAGNLHLTEDTFVTQSGRTVALHIYVDPGDEGKVTHAMASLKKAMKWDEERFGREYDLDLFQIVAVNDFNFGAMENKGLNIFNSSAILADPKTATDARYEYVEAVVAHEYFHNWSGNRVTCRDWFQLSLKEGFTVFRDSEFTADLNSRAVKRIEDVTGMRTAQFPEDAGAMAHPIRPASVGSIENFYTATVYEKGAEVIRMIHTLLGETDFRRGSDLYFERHDGCAVTTEDFVSAMKDVSGVDLGQFESTWYNQAGTPTLMVTDAYDVTTRKYSLTLEQQTPATPGQPNKQPFHIPVRVGLLDTQGKDILLELGEDQAHCLTQGNVLNVTKKAETFVFHNLPEKPVPSLLRSWSAPVKLQYPYTRDDLTFLMAHDTDGFNRWEAGQQLGVAVLQELVAAHQTGSVMTVDVRLIEAFKAVLQDDTLDPALAALTLTLPSLAYLAELYPDGLVDVDAMDAARKQARKAIGIALEDLFLERFNASRSTEGVPYVWNIKDVGQRAIKNTVLGYLMAANPQQYLPLAIAQYEHNHNMTDVRAALGHILNHGSAEQRKKALDIFYEQHQQNPLAMTQWFSDQALADRADVLNDVQLLLHHSAYDAKNPNSVRGLVGAFASNTVRFHNINGLGYQFLADQIIAIDAFNPMLAAGLSKRLAAPHKYNAQRQGLMKAQLIRITESVKSNNVREIVGKSLALLTEKQS
ncbi:MAG: aminopeptidase N [Vampirovibrionales bacterium]|nr:aminopeptidase N [Vampirovibrionales bacterium]